jgi:inosose dehydratase
MKFGFGTQVWLRDNHFENFYRMLDEMALEGLDGFEMCFHFLLEWYEKKPGELRRLLELHGLELADYYAAVCFRDEELNRQTAEEAKRRYEFAASVGSRYALLDEARGELPMRGSSSDHIKRVAEHANQMGLYARSLGLTLCWHNHWGNTFETPEPFAEFVGQLDNDLCGLCIDVGQLKLGGFDEVETVRKYADRIKFMHFKDVVFRGRPTAPLYPGGPAVPSDTGAYSVDAKGRWVELGRGEVDFRGVTKVLLDAGYDGWIVDDLDSTSYTARDSVAACVDYLRHGLGLR